MGDQRHESKSAYRSAVVLTTHERCGYFTSVLGDDIDLRLNPKHDGPLHDVLHNTLVAGGNLAIIDEAYFVDVDDMAFGLEKFFRREKSPERLKLIVVCTQREKGDLLLAFLVMYCGIYNIIYGKSGVEVSIELDRLMRRDNVRTDVIELAEGLGWQRAKQSAIERSIAAQSSAQGEVEDHEEFAFEPIFIDQFVDIEGAHALNVHIELSPNVKEKPNSK